MATTATGALTVEVDLGTATDAVPAPLARTLAQRYQTPTWHLLAQRLALDLSTTALETLQHRLGSPVLTAMSDTAFVDAMLTTSAPGDTYAFPRAGPAPPGAAGPVRRAGLASLLEARGPSPVELDYLLGVRQRPHPARTVAGVATPGALTVLSAAHYQAIRVALAHNTFQEAEGIPWPTAVLATGPARGYAELRPLVADTTPWLSPKR